MAELGVNAIAGMGRVVAALTDYHDALQGRGSLNLGRIEGGVGVTLVPDECRLAFDRQVFPGEDLDAVVAGLRELFAHVVATHGLDGDLVLDQSFPWWRADPGSTAVADLVAAHTAATGAPPRESVFRAYCEVELLARAGLDGVVYGPGDLRQAHRPDEFVDWPEVVTAARTYALLAAGVGTRYVSA
jgi:acetylornithine deacetylase/succinyl-diaminopimelate desuccinylase-like protein